MDKSFFIYVMAAAAVMYYLIGFIGEVQEEDAKYSNKGYIKDHQYDKYKSKDSIGRNILNLLGTDHLTQVNAWNESKLKKEFLLLFPDFEEMKKFSQERIIGNYLRKKLLARINLVEDKFFSGKITAPEAKKELSGL